MENEAFNMQMTLRMTGSLAILDQTGPKHAMATCQIRSRNPANKRELCNNLLGDYTHFASCKLSGYQCGSHTVLENVVLACIKDAYIHLCTDIALRKKSHYISHRKAWAASAWNVPGYFINSMPTSFIIMEAHKPKLLSTLLHKYCLINDHA